MYDDLIAELEEDLEAGILELNGKIKITRTMSPEDNNYYPILDYYYMHHDPLVHALLFVPFNNKYYVMTVSDVLAEMKKYNDI